MINILNLKKSTNITRKFPENITTYDEKYFINELEGKIPKTLIYKLTGASITKYDIKLFGIFNVFQNQTYFYKLNIIKRLKNIFRGLVSVFLKKNKIYLNEGIWICDTGGMNYFHWITDCLTRLSYVSKYTLTQKVILPESYRDLEYVIKSLYILGFEPFFYSLNDRLIVKKLYLPTKTAPTGNYSNELLKLRNLLIEKSNNNKNLKFEKIYISRKNSGKRMLSNEEDVCIYLEKKGFKVLFTDELSFLEQIEIFSNCKILISLHGAGLTNQIFMQKNSKIVEIRMENQRNNAYFSMSNKLKFDYFYIKSNLLLTKNNLDYYEVKLESLKSLIKNICSD